MSKLTLVLGLLLVSIPQATHPSPAYELGKGPVIAIDEAHKNSPTYDGYPDGIKALQDDGYRPRRFAQTISAASLADISILVMNDPQTTLGEDEVSPLVAWLKAGGSLLLALDHFASQQTRLTASLGVRNWPGNSVTVHSDLCKPGVTGCAAEGRAAMYVLFWRSESFPGGEPKLAVVGGGGGQGYQSADAVLGKHTITEGRGPGERITRVATYSGSAFEALPGGAPLLTLPLGARIGAVTKTTLVPSGLLGDGAFADTSAAGWLQGAVTEFGKGRVAVFADSAIVRIDGRAADEGKFKDNGQFVLNLMHWLSRILN